VKLIRDVPSYPPEELEVPDHAPIAQLFVAGGDKLDHVVLHFSDHSRIRWVRPTSHLPSTGNSAHRG